MQKNILCYGDSNTWGFVAKTKETLQLPTKRYGSDVRWPRLLQKLLGDEYYIIEEGLNGRTTNLNHHVAPDRNGKNYLLPCLYSHAPLDLVILTLGGNDLKLYYGRSAEDICNGMAELIDIIQTSSYGADMDSAPQILLTIQGPPLPIAEKLLDENGICLFKGAIARAKQLAKLCYELAQEQNCYTIDFTKSVFPSEVDGLHLDEVGHKTSAELFAKKIAEIF